MAIFVAIVAALSGIALIIAEALQSAKADGFSVITGMDSARFQPGTQEYLLERIARYSAIIWIVSVIVYAYLWYHSQ